MHDKKEQKYQDNELYQAFDLGVMKQTAINLQGKFKEFANQRPDKYWQNQQKNCKAEETTARNIVGNGKK